MSESKKNKFTKLYAFQKSFLNSIHHDQDYLLSDQQHGHLKDHEVKKLFSVYKNNFYASLIESLKATFPACAALLPDKVFPSLSTHFIRSFAKGNSIQSFSQVSSAFPDHLATTGLTEKIPFIKNLAEYEVFDYQFLKGDLEISFFRSKHPVEELRASILKGSKLKSPKAPDYFYRLKRHTGLTSSATRISKELYQKENSL